MKVYIVALLLVLVVVLAEAGRGGGGRRKNWYGPVTSETECSSASRSPAVAFKTDDVASTLCRDTTSQICVCLGPKSGKNGRGGRRNRNRGGQGESGDDFASVDFKFRCAKCTFKWNWKDAAKDES